MICPITRLPYFLDDYESEYKMYRKLLYWRALGFLFALVVCFGTNATRVFTETLSPFEIPLQNLRQIANSRELDDMGNKGLEVQSGCHSLR